MKCRWCGRTITAHPWKCRRCGGHFCGEHRLPEAHLCLGRGFWSESERRQLLARSASAHRGTGVAIAGGRGWAQAKRTAVGALLALFALAGLCLLLIAATRAPVDTAVMEPDATESAVLSPVPAIDVEEAAWFIDTGGEYTPELAAYFNTSPVQRGFAYYDTVGMKRKYINLTLYGGFADYLRWEDRDFVCYHPSVAPRSSYASYWEARIQHIFGDPYLDIYMAPLLEAIRNTSPSADQQAKNAISLVQHLHYSGGAGTFVCNVQDIYYPYETLYHGGGNCIDRSILLAYLLDRLGYDAAIFLFPPTAYWAGGHAAAGVRCAEHYDFIGSGYAFIETTGVNIPTYVGEDYEGNFTITLLYDRIRVGNGTRMMDVSREFRDARYLKGNLKIVGKGGEITDEDRMRLHWLIKKYGLDWNTTAETT